MNKIEKIQIPNIKDTSLLVVLDSIELEKTLGYHDLFLLWSPTFQKAGGSLTLAHSQNSQMSFMYGFFFVKFLFFTFVCVVIVI